MSIDPREAENRVTRTPNHEGLEKQIFKDLPPATMIALAFGPLIQMLRADVAGIVSLDYDLINKTINVCWGIVCRQEVPDQKAKLLSVPSLPFETGC
jgi:tetracycline repressor-like protein